MMTKLSVNINKIATLRNARGGNYPSVVQGGKRCAVVWRPWGNHTPAPDERHIRYQDAYDLKQAVYNRVQYRREIQL